MDSTNNKQQGVAIAIVLAAMAAVVLSLILALSATPANSADLGGNCCADLEERIAELEATTARKGNRKIGLTVSGQISKALLHVDGDGDSETAVIENSAAESYVAVTGEARIAPQWTAGYTIEVGVGGYGDESDGLFDLDFGSADEANSVYVRRSLWWIESPVGKGSVGLLDQATQGIAELTTANTAHFARMLSLRPLNGPQAGDALDFYDGSRVNGVRYDSPTFGGAVLSASWANGDEATFADSGNDVWDVALRWYGEGQGFKAIAGVGYRNGIEVPTVGSFATVFDEDIKVMTASGSVKHIETGLFVSAAYGKFDAGAFGESTAYHGQVGVERKWSDLGLTTVFAEYGKGEIDSSLESGFNSLGIGVVDTVYGVGFNQAIDGAALDLFVSARRLEVEDEDATLVLGGARLKF